MELSAHHSKITRSSRMRFSALRGGVPMRRKAPQIWLCVLAWVAALLPFSLFATCEECDAFRSSLLTRNQDITAEVQGMLSDFSSIIITARDLSVSLENDESAYKGLADDIYTQAVVGQSRAGIALEMLASNRVEILAFNCDCSSSSGCECAGVLTNMYDSLLNIEVYARETSYGMETLLHDLDNFKESVDFGFYNATNLLADISTNLFKVIGNFGSWVASERNTYLMSGNQLRPYSRDWSSYVRTQRAFYPLTNGLLPSMYAFQYIHFLELSSLNNYFYDFTLNQFPVLTNTVSTIHRDQTNFFKTVIAEVRPPHSLADWTPQDGSIYDYLTNQYIQARNGAESNWFGRVETLLAALVYQSSVSHDEELTELESGLDDVMDQQSELESQIYFEDYIEFLNFDDLSQPALPELQSRLPEVLSIKLGSFGSWLSDGSDFTIDIYPSEIRTLIEIIRGFFRLIWWGVVLGFVYLLWGWFVRLLKWVWSTLKGVDF